MSDCYKKNCNDECNHNCHNHCNHCHNKEYSGPVCPVCKHPAIKVPLETVKSLSKEKEIDGEFYLCTGKTCKVTYFNDIYLLEKEDLNTKIWFKEDLKDFIVCYCHNITLDDIIKTTKETNLQTKEEIIKYLNKNQSTDCLHKNPLGQSCDKLFINAIEYANKIK